MKMKWIVRVLGGLLVLLALVELATDRADQPNLPIEYAFEEPIAFPFEITQRYSEVDIENPHHMHQFVFNYVNEETAQELRYIVHKVVDEPEDVEDVSSYGDQYVLADGTSAFYDEAESTSQGLWWINKDGFTARIIYYIDGNSVELDDETRLPVQQLINLANQTL
ncbi:MULTISPECIES: hypothetical protein [Exiguobacterium]|uniref:hypothetical protein n=1 Tax=Exiguobacterium TaxID=33986 RepID=UPI001BE74211|nr:MULTISPECIES: hypothetical protein [Exiguobacterium]MCT4776015.1 hypothetical protein [Exiguobacterium aquaticum]MCT4788075.1 hypothetical protein [Exiguobacterium mexicanum]